MKQNGSSAPVLQFPLLMGKQDGFELVFRTYHQALLSFARKYIDADDANDVVENVFVRVWQHNQQMANAEHLRAFLYRSVYNGCLDFIKVSKRAEGRYQLIADQAEQSEPAVIQEIIRAEVLAEIYRAINDLPSQCSKVIRMSYLEGMTNSEIAASLDLSEQTVKNHKGRGLKILRDTLSGEALLLLMVLSNFSDQVVN